MNIKTLACLFFTGIAIPGIVWSSATQAMDKESLSIDEIDLRLHVASIVKKLAQKAGDDSRSLKYRLSAARVSSILYLKGMKLLADDTSPSTLNDKKGKVILRKNTIRATDLLGLIGAINQTTPIDEKTKELTQIISKAYKILKILAKLHDKKPIISMHINEALKAFTVEEEEDDPDEIVQKIEDQWYEKAKKFIAHSLGLPSPKHKPEVTSDSAVICAGSGGSDHAPTAHESLFSETKTFYPQTIGQIYEHFPDKEKWGAEQKLQFAQLKISDKIRSCTDPEKNLTIRDWWEENEPDRTIGFLIIMEIVDDLPFELMDLFRDDLDSDTKKELTKKAKENVGAYLQSRSDEWWQS